jgi:hypothetical protein
MDERAIIDPTNGNLLVASNTSSSVFYPNTAGTGRPKGTNEVVTFDPNTGSRSRFQLGSLSVDDHDDSGLIVLPDGRYLAMYSNHGNTSMGDYLSRYRISTNPHDSSSWSAEQSFDWTTVTGWNTSPNAMNRVSYHNLYYLPNDNGGQGQLYDFSRATHQSANALIFNQNTKTWTWDGQLTQSNSGGYSTGYVKYASNGTNKIYFMSTETHPRDFNNNLWAGYISDGKTYDMAGNLIDTLGNNVDTGGASAVPDINKFTNVRLADGNTLANPNLNSAASGTGIHRLWTVDISIGNDGNPVGMYIGRDDTATSNTNSGSTTNAIDHRLFYTRWNGSQWVNTELAKMGNRLYSSEQDYTGNGSLVPGDPNTVYVSTQYDPRLGLNNTLATAHREIYKGVTSDGGADWTWTAITQNSTYDNLRPIVPQSDGTHSALLWFRGMYTSAQNIDAAVVGIVNNNHERSGLAHYVDAVAGAGGNTTLSNGAVYNPTTGVGEGAADGNWHQRTGTGNGGSVLASGGSGSENSPMLRTNVTGLADGAYDVFAYFWANPAQDWRLQFGMNASNMMLARVNGAQQAEAGQFDPNDPVVTLTGASSSALYREYVGREIVKNGSALSVYVDDFSANATTRTWYDGVGYSLVDIIGDMNRDGVVSAADIQAMEYALSDLNGYDGTYHLQVDNTDFAGDVNDDGQFNNADLQALLSNLRSGGANPVPELSTFALMSSGFLIAVATLLRRGAWRNCRRATGMSQ